MCLIDLKIPGPNGSMVENTPMAFTDRAIESFINAIEQAHKDAENSTLIFGDWRVV